MPQLASDIYAVGIIALQGLSGLHPQEFGRDPQTGELDWRARLPNLSPGLVSILERMVCVRWQDRYANAMEAIAALDGLSVPTVVSAPAQPNYLHSQSSQPETQVISRSNSAQGFTAPLNDSSNPRKPWPLIAGIASAFGVLGIGWLIYAQQPRPLTPIVDASPLPSTESIPTDSSSPTIAVTPAPNTASPAPVKSSPAEASTTPASVSPSPTVESSATPDSSPVVPAGDREDVQTVTVIDPPSNVRTVPNGSIVCSIPTVTKITIFNPSGGWYQTDACGTVGYIHRSQIEFADGISEAPPEASPKPSSAASGQLATVIDPPSNIRVQPNGAILCSIASVQSIRVSSPSGDWYVTDACGSDGYIHRSQLRF
jgi:serine/threonine protein kinase, bacterial